MAVDGVASNGANSAVQEQVQVWALKQSLRSDESIQAQIISIMPQPVAVEKVTEAAGTPQPMLDISV